MLYFVRCSSTPQWCLPIWGLRSITSTAMPERMNDNKKTNPNCFGEGDRNLPNCECKLIYERIRNAEKPARSPHEDLLSVRNEQSGALRRTDNKNAPKN